MNLQILTERLSQALDQNYDVTNMDAVIEVITALEGTSITKEELETTRLAKFINQLRRRTKDERLARRAKSLLKTWREMVGINQSSTAIAHDNVLMTNANNSSANNIHSAENSISNTSYFDKIESQPVEEQLNFSNLLKRQSQVINNFPLEPNNMIVKSPIIIDIHDSNSSNLNVPLPINNNTVEQQLYNMNTTITTTTVSEKEFKTKKNKKDKKIKDNKNFLSTVGMSPTDESSTSLRQIPLSTTALYNNNNEPSQNSNNSYILKKPNVSEILSLSNSSVNSIFPPNIIPTVNTTSSMSNTNKQQTNFEDNSSDLTFTGKLKKNAIKNIFSHTINNTNTSQKSNIIEHHQFIPNLITPPAATNKNGIDSSDISSNAPNSFNEPKPFELQESQKNATLMEVDLKNNKNIPKKRGRRKGSKGVDSIIAKETSLSSQMRIINLGSGAKKVKTTKELFAEIQNRKMTNNNKINLTSSTLSIADKTNVSFTANEDKNLYETQTARNIDEVYTDDDTATSGDPSRDSNFPKKINVKKDNNYLNNKNVSQKNTIENQLLSLLEKMPPAPSLKEMEKIINQENIVCTCHIYYDDNANIKEPSMNEKNESNIQNASDTKNSIQKIAQVTKNQQNVPQFHIKEEKEKSDLLNTFKELKTPKKSIFDFDFDDDDDPLPIIKAEAALLKDKNSSENITEINIKSEFNNGISSTIIKSEHPEQPQEPTPIIINEEPLIKYKIVEDSNCEAKKVYETQTQIITNFHINCLHDFFIANINGNWNHGNINGNSEERKLEGADEGGDYEKNNIELQVVPKIGATINMCLPKTFVDKQQFKNFKKYISHKENILNMERKYKLPFLGVANIQVQTSYKPYSKTENNLTTTSTHIEKGIEVDEEKLKFTHDVVENTEIEEDIYNASSSSVHSCSSDDCESSNDIDNRNYQFKKKRLLKRKSRRYESNNNNTRIKRIKIALNGTIAAERKILYSENSLSSHSSTENNEEDGYHDIDNEKKVQDPTLLVSEENCNRNYENEIEIENENENENENESGSLSEDEIKEFHEVFSRHIDAESGNSHIVLTIKKTPNKKKSQELKEENESDVIVTTKNENKNLFTIGTENLFLNNNNNNNTSTQQLTIRKSVKRHHMARKQQKKHKKLFFNYELYIPSKKLHGDHIEIYKDQILNISSCSSNCAENSDSDINYNDFMFSPQINTNTNLNENKDLSNKTIKLLAQSPEKYCNNNIDKTDEDNDNDFLQESMEELPELSFENNGLLKSFNIFSKNEKYVSTTNSEPNLNEKTDNDNNNNNKIEECKLISSNLPDIMHKDTTFSDAFINGISTSSQQSLKTINGENVHNERGEQFKEWHQVLQLKSFNNELLTVLPYVVLE